MSFEATLQAINTNIRALVTQIAQVESLSADPTIETIPLAIINFGKIEFSETSGEQPAWHNLPVTIEIKISAVSPSKRFDEYTIYVELFRRNLTVDTLNTGALTFSKLVSLVSHEGAVMEEENRIVTIIYELIVRYRET